MFAIRQVMQEMFGFEEVARVPVHGRTDQGILGDLFAAQSLVYSEHQEKFTPRYVELLAKALKQTEGMILPGVGALLLELSQLPKVSLGILTGNGKGAADIKLTHFGLENYFFFGGYGDHHESRDQVAELARSSAEQYLGEAFDPNHVWVVGDTIHDITCARAIGAKVVAVETGGADKSELEKYSPDLLIENLQSAKFLDAVLGDSKVSD